MLMTSLSNVPFYNFHLLSNLQQQLMSTSWIKISLELLTEKIWSPN